MQNFVEIYQLVLEIQHANGWTDKTPLSVTCLLFWLFHWVHLQKWLCTSKKLCLH